MLPSEEPLGDEPPPRAAPARPRAGGRRKGLALALVALVATACAQPRDDDLFGLTLDVRSRQPWASDPELRRRAHVLIEEAAAHVGLDPNMLYGMTLRIEDDAIACGAVERARGCTWRDDGVIAVSTLAWISSEPRVSCIEDTPIPHELLHVKISDEHHLDPRWDSAQYWAPLWMRVSRDDCSGYAPTLVW